MAARRETMHYANRETVAYWRHLVDHVDHVVSADARAYVRDAVDAYPLPASMRHAVEIHNERFLLRACAICMAPVFRYRADPARGPFHVHESDDVDHAPAWPTYRKETNR